MKTKLFAVLATSLFSLSALAAVAGNACCTKNAKCCPGTCCAQQTQSCSCCNHK
ncbi:MAG: hypothetical protein WCA44_16145 [Acidobacteriaceae bacterium]